MGTPLTSTEIFIHGHTSWTEVGELPFPVMYGRGTVSIDNLIIATGHMISNVVLDNLHIYFALPTYLTGGFNGYDSAGNWVGQTSGHKDTILRFEPSSLQWAEVGAMSRPRASHALSLLRVEEVQQYFH